MLLERAPHFSIQVKGKKWFDLLKFTLQLMFLICEMRRSARSMCWGRGVGYRGSPPLGGQWSSSADRRPGTHATGNLPETQRPRAHPDPASQKLGGWAQESVLTAFWEGPIDAGSGQR